MARIRTVKPDFFRHEGLQDLEIAHPGKYPMLVFEGLWGHCDKSGRFEWRPRTLKLDVLPFLPFDMAETLGVLADAGFIHRYSSGGKEYGEIRSFSQHQRIGGKEAQEPVKHPEPTETNVGNHSGNNGEATGKQLPAQEGKGREEEGKRKGKEVKSSLRSDSPSPVDDGLPTDHAEAQGLLPAEPPTDLRQRKSERLAQVTDDAIASFNAKLGKPVGLLPAVSRKVGIEKRRNQVKRCLRTARQICEAEFGAPTITPEFWESYWAECDRDPFRSGRQPPGRGHENWTPSFEYLTREAVMIEVFDRAASEAA